MDCSLIQGDLIAYHFAAASDVERARMEAHLVECTACLRAYLALKSHVDRAGEELARPSEASRLRLRAAVDERFRPTPVRRVRRWLARPVPLYQGLAATVVLVLAATVGPVLVHRSGREATVDASPRVDTSRITAESISIY